MKKEDRLIKLRLQVHFKLMMDMVDSGINKTIASKKAYEDLDGLTEKELLEILSYNY